MKKEMYSIFDKKAGLYAAPFVDINKGSAIRAIGEFIKRGDHTAAKYPEDFQLVHLGSFDEESGEVTPEAIPVIVMGLQEITE